MGISNLNFIEQNSSVGISIPLFQINDTAEVIIDTLTIVNNQRNSSVQKRNLQTTDSYMNPLNR